MGMSFPEDKTYDIVVPSPLRDRFSLDDRTDSFVLPVVFICAWIIDRVGLARYPLLFYHEFGHGVVSWLSGRWAIPIPIRGFDYWGETHSLSCSIATLGILAWLGLWAWRERQYLFLTVWLALIAGTIGLSFRSTENDFNAWMYYGGSAGEIMLSALAVIAFYYKFPRGLGWNFWRFPFLASGACAFVHGFGFWISVTMGSEIQSMAEALGRLKDKDGDWTWLTNDFGWSWESLAKGYAAAAAIGAALILGHYIWFLVLSIKKRQKVPDSTAVDKAFARSQA